MDWIRKGKYPQWAAINFVVLALFGLLLRYMQLYSLPGADYQFLLHAHSHFAFAGWMFFAVVLLITDVIAADTQPAAFKTVFRFTLICAFGMLISFSFQGYKAVSIGFSTLFILVTWRFTYLIFKNRKLNGRMNPLSAKLIYAALIFASVSALGPFALGPLMASGLRNTPLYQNAIYFYLHFQMNGFMLLAALGLFASVYINTGINKNIKTWLNLFVLSTAAVFLIFTLWTKPAAWIWIAALIGTSLNLLSWLKLCRYFKKEAGGFSFLVNASFLAISIKMLFQVLICLPAVGQWTFLNRNLIIGYIHLLTLGCVMPLLLDQFIKRGFLAVKHLGLTNILFITAVVLYLLLLFSQPFSALFSVVIPKYQLILFLISMAFPAIGAVYFIKMK